VNSPQLVMDSYDMINASITAESNDGKWQIMLAGRNLGDETILISGSSGYTTGSGYTNASFARESEWRFSAKYSF